MPVEENAVVVGDIAAMMAIDNAACLKFILFCFRVPRISVYAT